MMVSILFSMFIIPVSFFLGFWDISYMMMLLFMFIFIKMNNVGVMNLISVSMGEDSLSYSMVCLSVWICLLMIISSMLIYLKKNYYKLFLFYLSLMLFSLIMTFYSLNMFIFYLFFEVSLVLVLLLILGWGAQPERIMAGLYLLFYTLIVSLPMMISMFYLFNKVGSLEFCFLKVINSIFLYYCVNLVFFVKIPMFMIHLWLPKAHVEAPISGSMILAGVMLKLGGYGILRTMKLFMKIGMTINLIFIILSIFGGAIISMICLRQSDMKMLIAYSSVSHMGMALSGMLTMSYIGMVGSLVLMLAHGLSSSGLFCIANLSYERSHSRSIYLNKGMINLIPSLSLWWFLFCSSNMSAPPSMNLLGEIILIFSLSDYSKVMIFFLFFLVFYSAAYSLFLYSYTQHGMIYSGMYSFFIVNIREFLLLFLHWVPLNILFLKMENLINFI
uniref:NADH-ubiquinone oxidoreductase chain 4 n=1 Tax=Scolytinae sp. BMNH 1040146 TaxID=1903785 RepID=A0A343A562_9CUCU|nr:NADH dehydrogenase subunit 4 [Scolytinae sp. BMNH 1040146]